MGRHQVLQAVIIQACEKLYRLKIVEMAMTATDPSLKTGWIRPCSQHPAIMVELEYQAVATGQNAKDMRCDMADIRQ
jgi:hypothetical protein